MTLQNSLQFLQNEDVARASLKPGLWGDSLRDDTLLDRFNSHFDILCADTTERIRIAQRIRYQVYCIEHPHETSRNQDGLEVDAFDSHAAQSLLVHRKSNAALGTLRLILPLADREQMSFPVQSVLDARASKELNRLPLRSTAEISRFSISRRFRRIADTYDNAECLAFINSSGALMRLGLMQALVRMSVQNGITHWCAAMEPTFQRLLAAMAIRFRPLGPLVEYHGLRQPCYGAVGDILNAVKRERPAFWSVLTDGGALFD
jgi:N-acyl amino acid synthase of PEP-CTERM/exosortase system